MTTKVVIKSMTENNDLYKDMYNRRLFLKTYKLTGDGTKPTLKTI